MRFSALISSFTALTAVASAVPQVIINNHLPYDVYLTQVNGYQVRGNTATIASHGQHVIPQFDDPGIAIKITPGYYDIDTAGKGVLVLGYTRANGWIHYDLGTHLFYPFPGSRVKLSGAGGVNDWSDGQGHQQNTIGYHGETDLTLDLGY